jgi:hypothetical protein
MTTHPLPPTPPAPPPPPGGPPKKVWDDKGNRVVLIGLAVGVALIFFMILVIGVAGSTSTKKSTTTASAAGTPTYVSPAPSTRAPTTASPTTTKAPEYVPTVADFQLEIIEIKRSCFGSAGCNITYKIVPTYTGPSVSSNKSYTIIYEVQGGDDVKSDNFTMRGSDASVKSQDFISTPSNPTLTATVTRVLG